MCHSDAEGKHSDVSAVICDDSKIGQVQQVMMQNVTALIQF